MRDIGPNCVPKFTAKACLDIGTGSYNSTRYGYSYSVNIIPQDIQSCLRFCDYDYYLCIEEGRPGSCSNEKKRCYGYCRSGVFP
jgi:hypothetical protein